MALHHMLRAAVQQQAAGPSDPYFYDVSLLLTGDGTNGAQNNTFLDSSTNNFTITRNGNTTQGTFSPYGSLWSNYFASSSDYMTVNTFTGTGAFTLECWIYPTVFSSTVPIFSQGTSDGSANFLLWLASDGKVTLYSNSPLATTSTSLTLNSWNHVALVSDSSNNIVIYINGVSSATGSISGKTFTATPFQINRGYGGVTNGTTMYLSNVRLVKGTALYTSNFTPSTTPLTAVSGTSLLTCQSNRFIDNSSNNFTLTVNGTPSVQRFSPFNPTVPYSASTIGGSGYFDGSGDYLNAGSQTAYAFGTGNFTVEAWIYPTATTGTYESIIDSRASDGSASGWDLGFASNYVFVYNAGFVLTSAAGSIPYNIWTHVAFVRNGSTITLYINGVSASSTSTSSNFTDSTVAIGANPFAGAQTFLGYIANARLVKGTAVYTTAFTPPTAPVTAVSGTSLLCNFTNAGIPDAAMMNDLETVGNAQVSTSVKKYGTGSLYFPATASSIKGCPFSTNLNTIFNGDFTVEFWYYPTNAGAAKGGAGQGLFDTRNDANAASSTGFAIYNNSTGNKISVYTNSSNLITSTTSPSNGTWYHIALTRSSGTMRLFINGTQEGGNASYATAFTDGRFLISGVTDIQTGTYMMFEGYLDDFRITKGYARYTANFTPPTAALPVY